MKSDTQVECPLLSIVTICKNSLHELERTTQSIQNQTFKSFKHIVIDGNSSDGTKAWLDYHKDIVSISEPDHGIYDAMNKGISLATGEIIGILNADDVYASNDVLQEVVAKFQNESVEGVYGDLKYVQKDNLEKVIRFWKSGEYIEGKFFQNIKFWKLQLINCWGCGRATSGCSYCYCCTRWAIARPYGVIENSIVRTRYRLCWSSIRFASTFEPS